MGFVELPDTRMHWAPVPRRHDCGIASWEPYGSACAVKTSCGPTACGRQDRPRIARIVSRSYFGKLTWHRKLSVHSRTPHGLWHWLLQILLQPCPWGKRRSSCRRMCPLTQPCCHRSQRAPPIPPLASKLPLLPSTNYGLLEQTARQSWHTHVIIGDWWPTAVNNAILARPFLPVRELAAAVEHVGQACGASALSCPGRAPAYASHHAR